MARIRIEDLPALEQLSAEELEQIQGAGRGRRLGLESLERREVPASLVTAAGVLQITGSSGADTVVVRDRVQYIHGAGVQVIGIDVVENGVTRTHAHGSNPVRSIDFSGGAGNDTFRNDTLNLPSVARGGAGDDTLTGNNANDQLFGDAGRDTLTGLGGNDTLCAASDTSGNGAEGIGYLTDWNASYNTLRGGEGNDLLYGSNANDLLEGGAGNDTAVGHAGQDRLSGEAGNDTLYGGSGIDKLVGGAGNDILHAGGNGTAEADVSLSARETLDNAAAGDRLYGDAEEEAGAAAAGDGADQLSGDDFTDFLFGGGGNDILDGRRGHDVLAGGDGNDILTGGEGKDTLTGGAGNDILVGARGEGGSDAEPGFTPASGQLFNTAVVNLLHGGDGDDVLKGGDANDNLTGAGGADKLYGHGGQDLLHGDGDGTAASGSAARVAGKDTLHGGTGVDALVGHAGDDTLQAGGTSTGQRTHDRFEPRGALTDDYYPDPTDFTRSHDGDRLFGDFEDGSGEGADTLIGDEYTDFLYGGGGNDYLEGGYGADHLEGGRGDDTLQANERHSLADGDRAWDALIGGEGVDTLDARDLGKNDHTHGGEGIDIIYTDVGRDRRPLIGDGDSLSEFNTDLHPEGKA